MARPAKALAERRDDRIGIRLTTAERVRIEQAAAAYGITAAEFLRRRALDYRMPGHLAAQRQTALIATALIRLGVNLNQIAKQVNAGRTPPEYLYALIERIERELERLYGSVDHDRRALL